MIRRIVLPALAVLLLLAAALRDGIDRWIDATELPSVLVETSVEMRDRHGALLRVFPVEDGRIRLAVDPSQVDQTYLDMLISYEDKRFFDHPGVDPLAILRAGGQALRSGKVVSGGSTLTMQVARLLENSGTGQWRGKLRQMRLALALERRLSKEEILALYLHHAPFGGHLEGVRAATRAWFGKEPARLSVEQAALLIALPQSPEARRPDRNPAAAAEARNRVIRRLGYEVTANGQDVPGAMRGFVRLAPHLGDRLVGDAPLRQVHSLTLDARLQSAAEDLMQRAVAGQPRGVSAAMVIADHRSGEVLATVGSPRYSDEAGASGFVDMTRAIRSPGSTLKPFVYALAFDEGLAHPETIIADVPVRFGRYAPTNFDHAFRGDVTLRSALQQSLNIPPVKLTHALGPARLVATLRRGGVTPVLPDAPPGLAVALGGVGLSLNDLVQLYAGLAQGGRAVPLRWEMDSQKKSAQTMFSRASAWQVGNILAGLHPPNATGISPGQIAYKTGTSYGHRDAWAVGFDGAHVIGVWLGRPDGTPVPGAFGGDLAAPILFEAFGRVSETHTPLPPPPPETLILGTAQLPLHLQRFRADRETRSAQQTAPSVTFPPAGAVLKRQHAAVPLKLDKGLLPLTILLNGQPVATGVRRRELLLPVHVPGFFQLAVIDALGRSDRVEFRLE